MEGAVAGTSAGQGGKIIAGYAWGEEVGKGAWGKVRRVVQVASGEEFAVKIFYRMRLARKIRNGVQLLYQEHELVRRLHHPNIIQYRELDDQSSREKFYLFMELCAGNLQTLVPTDDANGRRTGFIRDKFRQLLAGLVYLHSQHIAHHDIKTENILVSREGVVKISDFGVAEAFDPAEGCSVFFGTPAFQAPEVAGNTSGAPFDGAKADVWSAGVTLFFLVTQEYPFRGSSVYTLLQSIDRDPVQIPELADACLTDLLHRLLQKDPLARVSAAEAYGHQWLSGPENES